MTRQLLFKLSQEQRILNLLKDKGKATNVELNRICYRYSARIAELRREGHDIVTNRLSAGLFEYVYKGHRDDTNQSNHKENK